ncbi:MAG: c-type cytochrome biogenesis protein CcsB [Planctomycetes bacterium]|nr:c-type cytochrome biogenesis protein CcsB [Planctomycetota bacterium]
MRSLFFDATLYACLAASLAYLLSAVRNWSAGWARAGFWALTAAALSGIGFVAQEWKDLDRPPFATTFEVLTLLSVALMFVYLAFERWFKSAHAGPFVSFLALLDLAYATLFRGSAQPLMPALRNNFWLTVHVVLCFVGYAGFFLSFVAGILHLARRGGMNRAAVVLVLAITFGFLLFVGGAQFAVKRRILDSTGGIGVFVLGGALVSVALLAPIRALLPEATGEGPDLDRLDALVYRSISFGFPLLGLGIITGAVWANEAWGRYWGWDPKEAWSLATWLLYFVYLHLRFVRGWKGGQSSWFAVGGFYAVVFTFFGVNYLLPGLHGYLGR